MEYETHKMKPHIKSLLYILIPILILLSLQFFIKIETFYFSDSLVKYVQTKSIQLNEWRSESVIYPAYSFDPNFLWYPLNDGFVFTFKDKILGNYPVFFSFLYSIFPGDLLIYSPYTNIFIIYLFFFFLRKYLEIKLTYFFLFGTLIWALCIDFSENPIFLLLGGLGYLLIYEGWVNVDKFKAILGGVFIGLSVYFRLEGILFYISIISSLVIIKWYTKKNIFDSLEIYYSIIGFLFFLLIFWVFNYHQYENFMGTRYIVVVQGTKRSLFEAFSIFMSIVFTFWRGNNFSLGFFIVTPLFLKITINQLLNFKSLPIDNMFHLLSAIIYILLVGTTAPNDGITLTGRYLLLSTIPFLFLSSTIYLNKGWNWLDKIFVAWSIFISMLILFVFLFTSKEVRKIQSYLRPLKSDLFICSNDLISGGFGTDYFDKKVLSIMDKDNIEDLIQKIHSSKIQNVDLIDFKNEKESTSTNFTNKFEDRLIKIGYGCDQVVNNVKLVHFKCKIQSK